MNTVLVVEGNGRHMGRQKVNDKLLAKGYSEEDIRLIIPLLDRIQEKYQNDTSDKYSEEAIEEALNNYERIKGGETSEEGAREPKIDMVKGRALFRVGLLFFVLTLGYVSWYLFRTDIERPQVVQDYRKGLYLPERMAGDTFVYEVKVFKGEDQTAEYKETAKVKVVNKNEIEWEFARSNSDSLAKTWTYKNPFMLPLKSENYIQGDTSLVRYTGNVDTIFPLKVGNEYRVEVLRDSETLGESKFKELCKVESNGQSVTAVGNLDHILISCYRLNEEKEILMRKYNYSPVLGHFVKVTEMETLGDQVVRVEKQLVGVQGVKGFGK